MHQDQVTYQTVSQQAVKTEVHTPAHWEEALEFTKKVRDELNLDTVEDHSLVANIFIALATKAPAY